MLLFGIEAPQMGHTYQGYALRGFAGGADACNVDTDCMGGQTCNGSTGLCEEIGSGDGADTGCGAGMYWNINKGQCLPVGTSSQSTTSAQAPWWSTAITALTKGVVQSQLPKAGAMPTAMVAATPWYQTPVGIGGIAVGIIALVLLLKK